MDVHRRYTAIDAQNSRQRCDDLCAWLREYSHRRINSRLIDERRCIPPHVTLDFGNQGIFGMHVEERFGGLALRCRDVARVLEQAAALDLGLGTWLLTSMFPGVRPIAAFGSDALKDAVLRDLATGRVLAGYGQTEPGAGTHFPAMSARAVATDRGTWKVSGDKVWIGNATWAGVLTVMAHEIEGDRRRGLNAYAVPMDAPGVVFGRELLSLGMRGMVQSEISFRDVEVGEESVLGGRGAGLDVGVDSMSFSRFAIAATCVGAMKRCAVQMARFANRREIATGRLGEHPVLLAGLGEVRAGIVACEAVVDDCGALLDADDGVPVELFAVAKVAGSELLWASADRLVQTLGGRGYDESNGAAQLLRDARVTRIFEGTTEALVAYLGQQALNPRSDLHGLLRDTYASGEIDDALAGCVARVKARKRLRTGLDGDAPVPQRAWQLAGLGRAAAWAVLVSSMRARPQTDASVLAWAHMRFEEAIRNASEGTPSEAVMLAPGDVEKIGAGYAEEIGDLVQTLPGAKEEIDSLLLPDWPGKRS
jgi:alkylation response protein AidB-like acyl-CoA dehydrogenase